MPNQIWFSSTAILATSPEEGQWFPSTTVQEADLQSSWNRNQSESRTKWNRPRFKCDCWSTASPVTWNRIHLIECVAQNVVNCVLNSSKVLVNKRHRAVRRLRRFGKWVERSKRFVNYFVEILLFDFFFWKFAFDREPSSEPSSEPSFWTRLLDRFKIITSSWSSSWDPTRRLLFR